MTNVATNIVNTSAPVSGANNTKPSDGGDSDFAAVLDSVSVADDTNTAAPSEGKPAPRADNADGTAQPAEDTTTAPTHDDTRGHLLRLAIGAANDADRAAAADIAANDLTTDACDPNAAVILTMAWHLTPQTGTEVQATTTGTSAPSGETPAVDAIPALDAAGAPAVVATATGTTAKASKADISDPTLIGLSDGDKSQTQASTATEPAEAGGATAIDMAAMVAVGTTDAKANTPVQAPVAETGAATDVVAAAMVPVGATDRAKANTSVQASARDSEKSQTQASPATALAETGGAVNRNFAEQQIVNTLPGQGGAGQHTGNGQSGGSPPNQQRNADLGIAAAAARPADGAVAPAFTPAQAQPAPQPDPTAAVAATSLAPTTAASAVSTIHHPVQIQLSSVAPAQPDLAAMAVNIATHAEGGTQHFAIRLDPPELGRVDVRLTVDDAGRAQAVLSVEKPHTLELLQKDSTQLERALKEAGLDLARDGLNFSLKGQNQNGQAPLPRGRTLAARAIAAIDTISHIASSAGISASDTRLDIRV